MKFTIKEIGLFPGGTTSIPSSINIKGEVTGSADNAQGQLRAFFWSEAAGLIDIGALEGPESIGRGINDLSQIVGWADSGLGFMRPFLWSQAGGMQALQTLQNSTENGAWDINNAGQITGKLSVGNFSHACLWENLRPVQDLGTLGGPYSEGKSINASGFITGESQLSFTIGDGESSFIYNSAKVISPIGNLNVGNNSAWCISDNGYIVGDWGSPVGGTYQGFLWSADRGIINIGTLGGNSCRAYGVNSKRTIVGESTTAANQQAAFIRVFENLVNLNDLIPANSGWDLWTAESINENGQITGSGIYQGRSVGYVLTLTGISHLIDEVYYQVHGGPVGAAWPYYNHPVPDPAPYIWRELPSEVQDLLIVSAIHDISSRINDWNLKQEIRTAAVSMLRSRLDSMDNEIM